MAARTVVALLAVAITLLAPLGHAQVDPANDEAKQRAVDAVFAQYDAKDAPGFSVGIYQAGRELYARGYGMADLENPTANTADTIFHAASVSKHFTAFAVLLLAQDGKLDLDADVRTYLPYVPDFGHKMTTRHLIHHTSGLRELWSLYYLGGTDDQGSRRQSQAVNLVSRQRALNFTPGSEHLYCNTGYAMLAEIVKVVSGQSLREFATERMFKPLNMERTAFYDDLTEVLSQRARPYSYGDPYVANVSNAVWRRRVFNTEVVGATNLRTTARDLVKWARNFAHPRVGGPALIERFLSMGTLDDGTPINYGFGLHRANILGHQAIMHTGSDAGFRAAFIYFPRADFSVAVLGNASVDAVAYAHRVVEIYLGRKSHGSNPIPASAPVPTQLAGILAGRYVSSPSVLAIELEAGKLLLNAGRKAPLIFRSDGSFDTGDEPRSRGEYYLPVKDKGGRIIALEEGEAGDDGRKAWYRRVEPVNRAAVNLLELVGDYRSEELDATYSISLQGGKLNVSSLWTPSSTLEPIYQDVFGGEKAGLWQHTAVERGADGQVTALLLSVARIRNVRFDKVLDTPQRQPALTLKQPDR